LTNYALGGFVDENNERAMAGLYVLTRAMRRQQADALARITRGVGRLHLGKTLMIAFSTTAL
jgi:hypothetical protein